jgi:hypothetical protein
MPNCAASLVAASMDLYFLLSISAFSRNSMSPVVVCGQPPMRDIKAIRDGKVNTIDAA